MTGTWLAGLVRRQPLRLLSTAAGIAVAVALLASLGSFLAHSKATMTDRALRTVAVDWQVQVQPGADPASVAGTVAAAAGDRAIAAVGFARVPELSASTGGTTQNTGAGVVLGIPDSYRTTFPGEIRTLSGSGTGVLIAQQTASNLRAAPGDRVIVTRPGLPPATLTVAGVVDLPQADSLFQRVGAPLGTQPTAPPDNVALIPQRRWHELFDQLAVSRPDLISSQIHVARDHVLPPDPAAAYTRVTGAARNLEAAAAGGAAVGDNLAAALGSARQDAAYAQVLFLFLGLPAAVLAGLLTATIAAAGADRRRGEQALLRVRGASQARLVRLIAVESGLIGVTGCLLGLATAALVGRVAFGSARFGGTTASAFGWAGLAALAGLGIAGGAILLPAFRDLRQRSVSAGRAVIGSLRYPWWARSGLDALALAAAGLVFTATSRNGYQLVLAPEGVPAISVSYWAFAGPGLLWLGAGLLIWRLTDLALGKGRPITARLLRPVSGRLAATVTAGISRQRRPLVKGVVVLALALTFAISTATFNATYRAQAEADAQLTNGADVTVTEPPGAVVQASQAGRLAAVPGVRAVQPVQHRFAYIGTDLQDLYGVRPDAIGHATALQNGYFSGGTAASLMASLTARPDSILVSAETVKDYQLHPGDAINLRLVDSRTRQLMPVSFHYIGVVSEFPTAPKDSFFVANAAYITERTGSAAVGSFLIDTGGANQHPVAARVQTLLGTSAIVTDISTVRSSVGSSLTAVDLAGLTRVELTFALLIAAAAGGLVLALGLAERRRGLAIATALGARPRHLRAFIASETLILGVGGLIGGTMTGWVLSHMLVKVLTGVFDPPPAAVTVPWTYLATVVLLVAIALALVTAAAIRLARRPAINVLRRL